MSTIIKFDLKELKRLANDTNSCVVAKKVTQNLALQPWCLGNLRESIKNLLDYKIGKFDKEFNGILLSYKNLSVLQSVGAIRNDNADIHFLVQAEYFIFQPHVGATLKGIVNKKSTTHLGILVHRVFNVVIPRPTEEPGNKWVGADIQEGQEVVFRIVVLDLYGALPYIRGELDESWLKLGPDGDDDDGDTIEIKPRQILNVSYIDFDKTKPQIAHPTGDGLPNSSKIMTKINPKPGNKNQITNSKRESDNSKSVINGKSRTFKTKSDDNIKEKTKNKSQYRDTDQKQQEVNSRQNKKIKRES